MRKIAALLFYQRYVVYFNAYYRVFNNAYRKGRAYTGKRKGYLVIAERVPMGFILMVIVFKIVILTVDISAVGGSTRVATVLKVNGISRVVILITEILVIIGVRIHLTA